MSKKHFYKRVWFYVLSILVLSVFALFLIPYGLNGKSVGSQLVDTAEQFNEMYVYDEKDHWTDEQWNEYWNEHPQFTAVVSNRTDWETGSDTPDENDPRFEELPPDYEKLWQVDLHDLEIIQQHKPWSNELEVDDNGEHMVEEYIYKEKSTGNWIADVTLDGFILKLDPDYRLSWFTRSYSDANGSSKYRKALNLTIMKNMGDKVCRIEIAPHDWVGPVYKNETIEHPRYELTMRYESLHTPEAPRRFLFVQLDRTPYNTDSYSIEIDSTSPKECYDANLEMEILEAMTFTPSELKDKYLGSPNRFPLPRDWPHPDEEDFLFVKEDSQGRKFLEHPEFGIRVNLKPEWRVETYGPENAHEQGHDFEILESNRCRAYFSQHEATNFQEWIDYYGDGSQRGLGWASYAESKPYKDFPFDAYEMLFRELTGSDEDPKYSAHIIIKRIAYLFAENIFEVSVAHKDNYQSQPILEGQCDHLYLDIINSIQALTSQNE